MTHNHRMRKTVASAESCTGGLLGALLTQHPGSSEFYRGGVVAYDNGVKTFLLGVPQTILGKYGAVSSQTAESMAKAVRRKLKVDIGISITGIAGPEGGTKEKPVGLVYIAVADKNSARARKFLYKGDRLEIRKQAARQAYTWLRREII